jgi:hypothetical protein
VYLFYLDECANMDMSVASQRVAPWFVLTAAGIRDDCWLALDAALTALKKQTFPDLDPRLIEIKTTHLRAYGTPRAISPWAELPRSRIVDFGESFYRLYEQFDVRLFHVALEKKHHARLGPDRPPVFECTYNAMLDALNTFLLAHDEIGVCFLDEFKGLERQVVARYTWRRRLSSTHTLFRIIEPPTMVQSQTSQLIAFADVAAYNVYRRFREADPDYAYFRRLLPHTETVVVLP